MASIRSQLVLTDGMTGPLRNITKALNLTLNTFESIQRVSGRAIDTASIASARVELGRAGTAIKEIENNLQDSNKQQENLNNRISKGASNAGNFLSKIKSIATTYLSLKGVGELINLSDSITSTRARINNAMIQFDDGGSLAELEQKVMASAQRSRASYIGTASSIAKLGMNARDAFGNMDEVIAFQELINKQFVIGGANAQEQQAATLQLTQAMASGVLRGEELNSVFEQAPGIIQSIASYLDVPIGEIRQMAADGEISAGIVKNAMFAAADEIEQKFESMPKTWGQIWTSMKNRAILALNPVLAKINELANNPKVQRAIDGLIAGLSVVANVALGVFDVVCSIYNFMADNWGTIGPIIMGVVAALVLYKLAVIAITAVMTIASFVQGVWAIATGAATAAQYGLNAAIWSCPVTWIIALVIALIVLVAIFFEQIVGAIWWLGALFKNVGLWIANVSIAIWNSIKNIGLWFANLGLSIWAVIQNIGAWFGNLGMGIWEVMKACAGNIKTAFQNAWITIQVGFNGFVKTILSGVQKIIGWLNKIPGVNISTAGIESSILNYAGKMEELEASKQGYQDIGTAWERGNSTFGYQDVGSAWNTYDVDFGKGWTEGYNTFDVFQDGWGADAYNTGAEIGRNIKSSLSLDNIMNQLGLNPAATSSTLGDLLTDYSQPLDNISDDTSSIAGSVKSTDEDLKYLRDLAEQEVINRFTTAEVKIDMTGMTNRIDSNIDLDGVLNTFTEGFAEALEVAAEGVHV